LTIIFLEHLKKKPHYSLSDSSNYSILTSDLGVSRRSINLRKKILNCFELKLVESSRLESALRYYFKARW